MSLFQSLTVGVSGMRSQASKLGVISDNISNVNTVGYKGSVATFSTLMNGFVGSTYQPGGVKPGYVASNQQSGLLTATTSPTDIAISGRGFFAVSETANSTNIYFTRAGSFTKDAAGDLVNSNGFYLKGWRLDDEGNLPAGLAGPLLSASAAQAALVPINIDNITVNAIATTSVGLRANLKSTTPALANSNVNFAGTLRGLQGAMPTTDVRVTTNLDAGETPLPSTVAYDPLVGNQNMASGSVSASYNVQAKIYDASGAERAVNISYLKTAANTWAVEIYANQTSQVNPPVGYPAGLIAAGNITFNNDGTLASVDPTLSGPISVSWNTPTTTSTTTFDLGTIGAANGVRESNDSYSGIATSRPLYDPSVAATSMTTGGVTPHYTRTITVTDNMGAPRTVDMHFLKTAENTWEVELASVPAADLVTATGAVPGQIASGTITFRSDGSLASVSSGLSNAINVNWVGATDMNSFQINWGTIGASSGGLRQLNTTGAVYSSTFASVRNYAAEDVARNMTSGAVTPTITRPINVIDSTGVLRTLNFSFLKTGVNTWAVEIAAANAADIILPTAQIAHGIVTFNGDGSLASVSPALSQLTVPWATGTPSIIDVDLGTAGAQAGTPGATIIGQNDGLTQNSADTVVRGTTQNGSLAGENGTISIDGEGFVIGTYANGSVRRLFKIPIAEFISPDKLEALSSNVFAQSRNSGEALYFQAGTTQDATIGSSTLEASNVELSSELSNMIIAQRSYQSNSKLITTTDNMLEVIYRM